MISLGAVQCAPWVLSFVCDKDRGNGVAHLVTVAPEEVLCPDVLVRVLWLLLLWRLVGLVLPVLVPEAVGVDTGNGEAGDDDAVRGQSVRCGFSEQDCVCLAECVSGVHDSVGPARCEVGGYWRCVLDGQFAPEICRQRLSADCSEGDIGTTGAYHWWQQRGP